MMEKSTFQFSNPIMEELNFKLNISCDSEKSQDIEMNTKVAVAKSRDKDFAKVTLTFIIDAEKQKTPFGVKIVMSSLFRWTEDTRDVDSLLKINAPALLWSYIRPIIANAVINAGMPPFNLPFVDFTNVDAETVMTE